MYDYLAKILKLDTSGFSYVGIDIREEAIAGAQRHHGAASNAEFRVADLFELTNIFNRREFDLCFCSRVLVHLPHFEEAMRNLLFCSNADTFILVPVADHGRCELRKKVFLDSGFEIPYTFRCISKPMISAVAEANQQSFTIYDSKPYATIHFKRTADAV